jgi:predicted PurR-regulated permease PerM
MAMIRSNSSRILSQLLAVVVTVVLITVLYLAKTVILPLALAMLLTFVLAPVVTWLERVRLPRVVAIAAVMLAAGAILGSAGWTVFKQLVQVTDAIPSYPGKDPIFPAAEDNELQPGAKRGGRSKQAD